MKRYRRESENVPVARRLDPERTRSRRFGRGSGSSSSSLGDGQVRHGEQQQNVTDDSGAEVGQPHCCSTQAQTARSQRSRPVTRRGEVLGRFRRRVGVP